MKQRMEKISKEQKLKSPVKEPENEVKPWEDKEKDEVILPDISLKQEEEIKPDLDNQIDEAFKVSQS